MKKVLAEKEEAQVRQRVALAVMLAVVMCLAEEAPVVPRLFMQAQAVALVAAPLRAPLVQAPAVLVPVPVLVQAVAQAFRVPVLAVVQVFNVPVFVAVQAFNVQAPVRVHVSAQTVLFAQVQAVIVPLRDRRVSPELPPVTCRVREIVAVQAANVLALVVCVQALAVDVKVHLAVDVLVPLVLLQVQPKRLI